MKLRFLPFALTALLIVSAVTAFAAETPIPPPPTAFVTDTAGFMSPGAVAALNSRLQSYQQQTGHQIVVYIGKTTGDAPIEDWAVHAFEKWKIGNKGMDDGLALFIMAQDHKLRIEVGYGLEPDVTDALSSQIINDIMVPRIRAGDNDGAVTAGIDAVASIISGQALPAGSAQPNRGRRSQPGPMTLGRLILYGIIGVVVLIIFITNPTLAMYLLMSMLSGGGRGGRDDGWGGGGGGFSGGGGRSGGGGASGSW